MVLLKLYIVHSIDHDEAKVTFRKLLRRHDYHQGLSTCLNFNEVILTNKFIEHRGTLLKHVKRRYGMWYLPINADVPDQLQLNGTGKQFYFTYKLDNDRILPCSLEDFKTLRLELVVLPLT